MFGIIAGQADRLQPRLTPEQRRRHFEIARAQQAPFRRRGRIPTDRYYQDIIDAARQRGSYRRPTYGETYGQRIVDRLNGRRSSGSGNFGFRPSGDGQARPSRGGQVSGFWAGDPSRGIPGEWDNVPKPQRRMPRRNPNIPRGTETWGDWGQSKERTQQQRDRFRRNRGVGGSGGRGGDWVVDGGWDRGGRVWDDPAPSRRRRKRKDRKKKKRRRSSKTMPISRRTFEKALNRYARKAPRDNSRYRRDFYGQNRGDVDYSRFRRDFFGHNLRPKRRQFDF